MRLFILKRTKESSINSDEYAGKVVRAKDQKEAREIANLYTGDEGKIWENPKLTSCYRLFEHGPAGEIISDFRAG